MVKDAQDTEVKSLNFDEFVKALNKAIINILHELNIREAQMLREFFDGNPSAKKVPPHLYKPSCFHDHDALRRRIAVFIAPDVPSVILQNRAALKEILEQNPSPFLSEGIIKLINYIDNLEAVYNCCLLNDMIASAFQLAPNLDTKMRELCNAVLDFFVHDGRFIDGIKHPKQMRDRGQAVQNLHKRIDVINKLEDEIKDNPRVYLRRYAEKYGRNILYYIETVQQEIYAFYCSFQNAMANITTQTDILKSAYELEKQQKSLTRGSVIMPPNPV